MLIPCNQLSTPLLGNIHRKHSSFSRIYSFRMYSTYTRIKPWTIQRRHCRAISASFCNAFYSLLSLFDRSGIYKWCYTTIMKFLTLLYTLRILWDLIRDSAYICIMTYFIILSLLLAMDNYYHFTIRKCNRWIWKLILMRKGLISYE